MTLTCRTVFVSDVHLGTSASRAADLLDLLNTVVTDRLYLVGDIIDIEQMKGRSSFTPEHHNVINRLLQLATSGTDVIYIPGNHDREIRALVGSTLKGVQIKMEDTHVTADGSRFLVTHGDVLDQHVRKHNNLEVFGAAAYHLLLEIDVQINKLRSRFGHDYAPISTRLKQSIASAQRYIAKFEAFAATYARQRGFDGIICGHIHKPEIRDINGIRYVNDGDWVEHRSAVTEAANGELTLLHWDAVTRERLAATPTDSGALAA
ncbi:MAG: UDP-2,3-diacylglucosamine diphosphatase [Pseudomonadota bacterium]